MRHLSVSERADVSCCGLALAQAASLEALAGEGRLTPGDLGRRRRPR